MTTTLAAALVQGSAVAPALFDPLMWIALIASGVTFAVLIKLIIDTGRPPKDPGK